VGTIQIMPESKPSTPSWMGEVAAFAQVLTHVGILQAIREQVRFARARFGQYDLLDFVVVLIGYAVSGEPTLLAFYERLLPFAEPFMALFGRHHFPHRSTLSRFLAALDQTTVEALRVLFLKDLEAQTPCHSVSHGHGPGFFPRCNLPWQLLCIDTHQWVVLSSAFPPIAPMMASCSFLYLSLSRCASRGIQPPKKLHTRITRKRSNSSGQMQHSIP
jgi:hypothetical protein